MDVHRSDGEGLTFRHLDGREACVIPGGSGNVLCAGRGAFGAVRVMVSCNQTGEAAGTACRLALQDGCGVAEIDAGR